jgi:hypothetical protein
LQDQGVTVAFARVRDEVRQQMRVAGIEAIVGVNNFYERVTDGVREYSTYRIAPCGPPATTSASAPTDND